MPYQTLWLCVLSVVLLGSAAAAQPPRNEQDAEPPAVPSPQAEQRAPAAESDAERNQRFAQYMTGARLVGRFTVLGRDAGDGNLPEEEYLIRKCEKLPQGDLFRFTARIRYGDTDTEVPMDLPVKWAGATPVISLDNVWIPGLGTFSSHVIIRRDRYAGTWDHGDKGGHLFGRIERSESP